MTTSFEEETWEIFSEYILRTNPLDIELMPLNSFRLLCRECKVISKNVTKADIDLAFQAEISKLSTITTKRKKSLTFTMFLGALLRLAKKQYPNQADEQIIFQDFVREYILKNAKRYSPLTEEARSALKSEEILKLKHEFEPSLKDMIYNYQQHNHQRKGQILISHRSFIRFANDYDLLKTGILTTFELGEIFLWAVTSPPPLNEEEELTINFDGFWNCLVRFSVISFPDNTSTTDRMKGLLAQIWRAIEKRTIFSSSSHEDTAANIKFKNKFASVWQTAAVIDSSSSNPYGGGKIMFSPPNTTPLDLRSMLKTIPSPVKGELTSPVPYKKNDEEVID